MLTRQTVLFTTKLIGMAAHVGTDATLADLLPPFRRHALGMQAAHRHLNASLSTDPKQLPAEERLFFEKCTSRTVLFSALPASAAVAVVVFAGVSALSKRFPWAHAHLLPQRAPLSLTLATMHFNNAVHQDSPLSAPCYMCVMCGNNSVAAGMREAYRKAGGVAQFVDVAESVARTSPSTPAGDAATSQLPPPDMKSRLEAVMPFVPHPSGRDRASPPLASRLDTGLIGPQTGRSDAEDEVQFAADVLHDNVREDGVQQRDTTGHAPRHHDGRHRPAAVAASQAGSAPSSSSSSSPHGGVVEWRIEYDDPLSEAYAAMGWGEPEAGSDDDGHGPTSTSTGGGSGTGGGPDRHPGGREEELEYLPSYVVRRRKREELWAEATGERDRRPAAGAGRGGESGRSHDVDRYQLQ